MKTRMNLGMLCLRMLKKQGIKEKEGINLGMLRLKNLQLKYKR